MTVRNVFYSFHFGNDVMRVQQIRNMGVVAGDEPVTPNKWEEIKRSGEKSIETWIAENMKGKSCLIALIGTETHKRPWVKYEIKKAWQDGLGVFGININNLKCPNAGTCDKGKSPFDGISFKRKGEEQAIAVYDPSKSDAYGDIEKNMTKWVEAALKQVGRT